MKNQKVNTFSVQYDPALESMIQKVHAEIKDSAKRDAEHYALTNRPALIGDSLLSYTNGYKTRYEKLAVDAASHLQAIAHFPEAKLDHDLFKEKDGNLLSDSNRLEHQIQNDEHKLGNFNPGSIAARIKGDGVCTIIIVSGEILFNTKAFQVTGENLLFALILSISVSFAVMVFSHIASFVYKVARNAMQRRLVVTISLLIATGLFTALAIFRSQYLASHDVHINPFYFVIINLFFFIVTALLSLFILPTWQEIKQNFAGMKLSKIIAKRKKELNLLKSEREQLKEDFIERTKRRARVVHYSNSISDTIRKMYYETVGVFIDTNLAKREDKQTPECFWKIQTEPDIKDFTTNLLDSYRKLL